MTTVHSDNRVRLIHRPNSPSTPLALCRNGESIHLRSINNESTSTLTNSDQSPIAAHVSVVVEQDPYPGFTMDGRQMIWLSFLFYSHLFPTCCTHNDKGNEQLKNYGENAGLLEELEQARIVQSVGRTIKQGFVTFPLCIVLLSEKEMLQTCTYCERVERVDELERFKRCGKCKRRYYCSQEHQSLDWTSHKPNCKDLQKLDFVSVENRRRQSQEGLAPRARPLSDSSERKIEDLE